MNTVIYSLDGYKNTGKLSEADRAKLSEAAILLRDGGLVAFPTETVYGLGGNALLPEAAKKIYAAKGRPSDNPLIVHIAELSALEPLVSEIPDAARRMAAAHWPGPLTMVFPKSDIIPPETTGGLPTVAVRFPVHPVAAELIRLAGVPVAAPSANRSGRPSTTTAAHCVEDLSGRVDAIVDGGSCEIGLESTILDVSMNPPWLLRPGAVTREMIEGTLGTKPVEDEALKGPLQGDVRPRAPGMKYRHYAPKAPMLLAVPDGTGTAAKKLAAGLLKAKAEGDRAALICTKETLGELKALDASLLPVPSLIRLFENAEDQEQMAHDLFELLRGMDETEAECILAEGCSEEALGFAIMNRLKKAAGWQLL